jgi:hypothetical protein
VISAIAKRVIRFIVNALAVFGVFFFTIFFIVPYLVIHWAFDLDRPPTADEYWGRL